MLVIPAIAALTAANYEVGVFAYGMIGGAAARRSRLDRRDRRRRATTTWSCAERLRREVVVVIAVLIVDGCMKRAPKPSTRRSWHYGGAALSAVIGSRLIVFGILKSSSLGLDH